MAFKRTVVIDGHSYDVTTPNEVSEVEAYQYALSQHQSAANAAPAQQAVYGVPDSLKPSPPDQPNPIASALGQVGDAGRRVAVAGAQGVKAALGNPGVQSFLFGQPETPHNLIGSNVPAGPTKGPQFMEIPGVSAATNYIQHQIDPTESPFYTGMRPAIAGLAKLVGGTLATGVDPRTMGVRRPAGPQPQPGFPSPLAGPPPAAPPAQPGPFWGPPTATAGSPPPPAAPGMMDRIKAAFASSGPVTPPQSPAARAAQLKGLDQQFQRNIGVKYAGVAKQEAGLNKQFGAAVAAKNAAYDADEAAKAALNEQFQRGLEGKMLKDGLADAGAQASRDRARDIVDLAANLPEDQADVNKAFSQARAGVANMETERLAGVEPNSTPGVPPKPPKPPKAAPTKGEATARLTPGAEAAAPKADLTSEQLIDQVLAKRAADRVKAAGQADPTVDNIIDRQAGGPDAPPVGNGGTAPVNTFEPPPVQPPVAAPPPVAAVPEPIVANPPPPKPRRSFKGPPASAQPAPVEGPVPVQPAQPAPVAGPPAAEADPMVANPDQAPPAAPYGFMPQGRSPADQARIIKINEALAATGQPPIMDPRQIDELLGAPEGAAPPQPPPAQPTVLTPPEVASAPPRLVKKGAVQPTPPPVDPLEAEIARRGLQDAPGEASAPPASQPPPNPTGDAPGGAGRRAEPSSAPGEQGPAQSALPPGFVVPAGEPGPRIADTAKKNPSFAALPADQRAARYKALGGLEAVSAGKPEDAQLAKDIQDILARRGGGKPPEGGTTLTSGFNPFDPARLGQAAASPAARGAVGGTIGYNTTDDPRQKYVNALVGAALAAGIGPGGMVGPGSVGPSAFYKGIRRASNENLLEGAPIIAKAVGDTGSAIGAPVIKALQGEGGDALKLLKAYLSPSTYANLGRDALSYVRHGDPNVSGIDNVPSSGLGGKAIGGINHAFQQMYQRAGLSPADAETFTFSANPSTIPGKVALGARGVGGQKVPGLRDIPIVNLLTPFMKFGVNAAEQGAALTPARFLSPGLRNVFPAAKGSTAANIASNIALSAPGTAAFIAGATGHDPFSNPTTRALSGAVRFPLSIGSEIYDAGRYNQDPERTAGRAVSDNTPLLPDLIRAVEEPTKIPQMLASRTVPAASMGLGDQTVRKVGGDQTGHPLMDIIHSINDAITNRIPDNAFGIPIPLVNRTSLPPQVTYYGQPEVRSSYAHVPPPLYQTDPVANKAADLKMLKRSQPPSLPTPIDEPKAGSGNFNMRTYLSRKAANAGVDENTPHLQAEWQQLRGQAVSQADHMLLSNPQFASMDPDMVASLLGPLRQKLITIAEEQFRASHPELSAYKGLTAAPQP